MTPRRALLAPLTALLLAGCPSVECQPENLPAQGQPTTTEELFAIAKHAAVHDCDGVLYDLLSAHSQEEINSGGFRLFWRGIDIEGYPYELGDVVTGGVFVATMPGPRENEEFAYVEYEEPGKPNLLAQILVVFETDEQGTVRPSVALQEQVDQLKQQDPRYNWDAGR